MRIQTVKRLDTDTLLVNSKHQVSWPTDNWYGKVIQEWLDAGNTITAADPPPAPPTNTQRVNRIDPVLRGLLRVYARDRGITIAQLKSQIAGEM